MRVPYNTMLAEFERVLTRYGFPPDRAHNAAEIFAQNSLTGVFSHGLNRFPVVVEYLRKGVIDPGAEAVCTASFGAMERRIAGCHSSETYSATSSRRQPKIAHSLFSICVDTGIFAFSRCNGHTVWLLFSHTKREKQQERIMIKKECGAAAPHSLMRLIPCDVPIWTLSFFLSIMELTSHLQFKQAEIYDYGK